MNLADLEVVKFGDKESLNGFIFENGIEHKLFWNILTGKGYSIPKYPIIDADTDNLDDWLLIHYIEHKYFADILGLEDPNYLLDTDWNVEVDFYDWVGTHYIIHSEIAAKLGV
mgnify:CR=1 FL=1